MTTTNPAAMTSAKQDDEELSLDDILHVPHDDDGDDDPSASIVVELLQECLGVTATGTCNRHVTCPVVTGLTAVTNGQSSNHRRNNNNSNNSSNSNGVPFKVVSCRVCYAEEKSVGIRQNPTFAFVVQQLKQLTTAGVSDDLMNNSAIFHSSMATFDSTITHSNNNSNNSPNLPTAAKATNKATVESDVISNNHNNKTISTNPGHFNGPKNKAEEVLTFLQYPRAMESCLKRLNQVQNWLLRSRETDLLALQLQVRNLEHRLTDSQRSNEDLRGTVKQLRRTIQQDLKVIKTMATQQLEDELAAATTCSQHGNSNSRVTSPLKNNNNNSSPSKPIHRTVRASPTTTATTTAASSSIDAAATTTTTATCGDGGVYRYSSPIKRNSTTGTGTGTGTGTTKDNMVDAAIPEDGEEDLEEVVPLDDRSTHNIAGGGGGGGYRQYWKQESMKSSKIFQSFRGGLLDIPKSPPAARHDRDEAGEAAPPRKQKLQLNTAALNALQLPARALSRSSSRVAAAAPAPLANAHTKHVPTTTTTEISIDALAAQLSQQPPLSAQRTIHDQSPEQFFSEHKLLVSHVSMPLAPPLTADHHNSKKTLVTTTSLPSLSPSTPVEPPPETNSTLLKQQPLTISPNTNVVVAGSITTGNDHFRNNQPQQQQQHQTSSLAGVPTAIIIDGNSDEANNDAPNEASLPVPSSSAAALAGASENNNNNNKFVFSVTGATCRDKFGDEGTYTGHILVTEGLPHGRGKMDYESGRVYDGEWVAGQWHGHGQLLNPNGDRYDGAFFFDARHGQGVYRWDNGDVYTGSFHSDKRHGQGRFSFHNGNVYHGEFCDGMFDGFGRYEFAGGYYEGDWKEGRYDGAGELMYANGGKYTGEFRNSVAHGFGLEVMPDGNKRRGVWVEGKPTESWERE